MTLRRVDTWWTVTAHGRCLHAPLPGPAGEPELDADDVGVDGVDGDEPARTVCGEAILHRAHWDNWRTPRCTFCCSATGIPAGVGPPIRDNRARRRLGLPVV